jgi:hypothetical protein
LPAPNPFRIHGRVSGPHFTDRAAEVRRVVNILGEPAAKMLVSGRRRMGKTSILGVAEDRARRSGIPVLYADLSTATSLAEVSTRLLTAATEALGRRWKDVLLDIAKRAAHAVTLSFKDGHPTLGLSPAAFADDVAEHKQTLGTVLDAINSSAKAHKRHIGIIIDEFQEIQTIADANASWHLRGIIQRHEHVSYVCAGSRRHLIEEITGKDGAFFKLLDPPLEVGPIEPEFFAEWIESRLEHERVKVERGVGARCVALAAPCTRDVVQLARAAFELASPARKATVTMVDNAFGDVVAAQSDAVRHLWEKASPAQQHALRAVAGASAGLTTEATRKRFALGPSGVVAGALPALLKNDWIVKDAQSESLPTGYAFDSPFARGWVIAHALPDLGIQRPMTALPGEE